MAPWNNKTKAMRIWCRSSIIPATYIGKKVRIHSGIWLLTVSVKPTMVGSKFGDFAVTTRMGRSIHFKKKSKKKNKK